ncbi:ABC-2 family transporter protein [Eubacterium ruminantium]|nr:ABC-2 family transporter protein [Eubacterium ruminantium]
MQINPITKKDIKITARGKRFFIELFIYELIVMITFVISIDILAKGGNLKTSDYTTFSSLFPAVSLVQLIIVSFVIPVMTGASISGEKERQTFDIMLTTATKPVFIVWGKLFSVVVRVIMFVIASIPLMAVSFVSGSISWSMLFLFIGMMVVYSFFIASLGIYASAICRRSMTAIIFSFVLIFVITFGTVLVALLEVVAFDRMIVSSAFLLLNPMVYFEGLFMVACDKQYILNMKFLGGLSELDKGYGLIIVSSFAMILLTMLFIIFASRKIDPLRNKK